MVLGKPVYLTQFPQLQNGQDGSLLHGAAEGSRQKTKPFKNHNVLF